jgi:hypothetical protein
VWECSADCIAKNEAIGARILRRSKNVDGVPRVALIAIEKVLCIEKHFQPVLFQEGD